MSFRSTGSRPSWILRRYIYSMLHEHHELNLHEILKEDIWRNGQHIRSSDGRRSQSGTPLQVCGIAVESSHKPPALAVGYLTVAPQQQRLPGTLAPEMLPRLLE